jgi:hypothetical protein
VIARVAVPGRHVSAAAALHLLDTPPEAETPDGLDETIVVQTEQTEQPPGPDRQGSLPGSLLTAVHRRASFAM